MPMLHTPRACTRAPCSRRLAILYRDWHAVRKLLARAKVVCEAGGDWEHKNKLKVCVCVCMCSFWC
jgi:hypothetical protein